jgi:hypothetical protein
MSEEKRLTFEIGKIESREKGADQNIRCKRGGRFTVEVVNHGIVGQPRMRKELQTVWSINDTDDGCK